MLGAHANAIQCFNEAATGLRAGVLPLAPTLADLRLIELLVMCGETGDPAGGRAPRCDVLLLPEGEGNLVT